ncbi:MAG: hypothetical protein OXM56_08375 [Gammaproteobacteria bacterium]|nr:hypothetical protein [Gammaproteobacteria bacterium]
MTATNPTRVHLVGSIPLTNAESVFAAVARTLGSRVARIPDGETGERSNWIAWQLPLLQAHPHFEVDPQSPEPRRASAEDGLAVDAPGFRFLRVAPGVAEADLHIETRYAEHAIESFRTFDRLQRAGRIAPGVRFQVSLPTPYAVASLYVAPGSWPRFLPAYERALVREIATLADAIPAERLAIQWDVCMEVIACEGLLPVPADDAEAFTFGELGGLCSQVDPAVEVGIHLCYGDASHEHIVEPTDARILTRLANGIVAAAGRRLDWIHLPVPKERHDAAFFEPLKRLRLPPQTRLYLGLVHMTDAEEGAQRRIAAARAAVAEFGIATECGFGRRPPETVVPLLELHERIAERADP